MRFVEALDGLGFADEAALVARHPGRRAGRPRRRGHGVPENPGAAPIVDRPSGVRRHEMKAQISQFDIAEKPDPYGIAVTDDGAVWVTMVHSGAVMRLTPDGTHTRYPVGQASRPSVVTAGHGGSAWFTRTEDDRVSVVALGRLDGHRRPRRRAAARSASAVGPTARCGAPRSVPVRSDVSTRTVRSPSSRCRTPRRGRTPSPQARTAAGSPSGRRTGSGTSHGQATSMSSTCRRRHPNRMASPSGRTGRCGWRWRAARCCGSLRSDGRVQILRIRASHAGSSTRVPTASPSCSACISVTTPR